VGDDEVLIEKATHWWYFGHPHRRNFLIPKELNSYLNKKNNNICVEMELS